MQRAPRLAATMAITTAVAFTMLLLTSRSASAQQEGGSRRGGPAAWQEEIREAIRDVLRRDGRQEAGGLQKTMHITFHLVSDEGDEEEPLTVATAGGEYALAAAERREEGSEHFEVAGQLLPGPRDDAVLLTFEVEMRAERDEEADEDDDDEDDEDDDEDDEDDHAGAKVHVHVAGSAVLRIGRRTRLAALGSDALEVTVEPADD